MSHRHNPTSSRRHYRGIFSSSICDLFQNRDESRTDACALACCGIWLWERNYYLWTRGQKPVSWTERFTKEELALVAIGILFVDPAITLLVWAGWRWRRIHRARQNMRLELAIHHFQNRSNQLVDTTSSNLSEEEQEMQFLRIHEEEVFGPHKMCTCIPIDVHDVESEEPSSAYGYGFWQCLTGCCCGCLCNRWLNLCGMCAVAQESRHMRNFLPPNENQLLWQCDYITFQPWSDYFPKIESLRRTLNVSFMAHTEALSLLSKRLAIAFAILLAGSSLLLSGWNLVILLATMLQPVLLLYFVYWYWNRFDISLDAIIKYFAAGFVISIGMTLFYGTLLGIAYDIWKAALVVSDLANMDLDSDTTAKITDHNQHILPSTTRLWLAFLTAFVRAFILAAFLEEFMKYLSFWMIEHPDFCCEKADNEQGDDEDDEEVQRVELRQVDGETIVIKTSRTRTTLVSQGAAITIAMIATAAGFACHENLDYVFARDTHSEKLFTLLFRSAIPLHILAAAMQSIGVCRRELEGDTKTGLVRILLPSILLHGKWDFVIMATQEVAELYAAYSGEEEDYPTDASVDDTSTEDGSSSSLWQGLAAILLLSPIAFMGVSYYFAQARAQRKRLEELDMENARR